MKKNNESILKSASVIPIVEGAKLPISGSKFLLSQLSDKVPICEKVGKKYLFFSFQRHKGLECFLSLKLSPFPWNIFLASNLRSFSRKETAGHLGTNESWAAMLLTLWTEPISGAEANLQEGQQVWSKILDPRRTWQYEKEKKNSRETQKSVHDSHGPYMKKTNCNMWFLQLQSFDRLTKIHT